MGVVLKMMPLIGLVYGVEMLIFRQNCKSYAMLSVSFDGMADSGPVLEETTSKTEVECNLWCSSIPACKSVNFRAADGRCQLMERGKKASAPFLVKKAGWTYITTDDKDRQAVCHKNYYGANCEKIVKDCNTVYESGSKEDGVYNINVNGSGVNMNVFCDMTDKNEGWIVIQRRIDDSVDFYRNWTEYKKGFGDLSGNMWIGLDKLHLLAGPGKRAILRVDLKHYTEPSKLYYAEYTTFEIGNEAGKYKLVIGGYSGTAGDSMAFHNGMKFSTYDNENDGSNVENCAENYKGAWWYNHCHHANLNGLFVDAPSTDPKYMSWFHMKGSFGNIIYSEMKIKYL